MSDAGYSVPKVPPERGSRNATVGTALVTPVVLGQYLERLPVLINSPALDDPYSGSEQHSLMDPCPTPSDAIARCDLAPGTEYCIRLFSKDQHRSAQLATCTI
ncbi:hypothetical protein OBBRIDRAFT_80350 [Obba rivulosa]|uniref:Uncharacterized protein n=1 Tax=Obba rivulosa TaxID=1052685 RepID=A0A8E2DHT3_9APHY|nr:hypothetical protein OBBRIDRAFT_80350 [Obba rivulosa]